MEPRAGDINSAVNYAARLIEKQAAVVQAARDLIETWPLSLSSNPMIRGLMGAVRDLDAEFAPDPLVHA